MHSRQNWLEILRLRLRQYSSFFERDIGRTAAPIKMVNVCQLWTILNLQSFAASFLRNFYLQSAFQLVGIRTIDIFVIFLYTFLANATTLMIIFNNGHFPLSNHHLWSSHLRVVQTTELWCSNGTVPLIWTIERLVSHEHTLVLKVANCYFLSSQIIVPQKLSHLNVTLR